MESATKHVIDTWFRGLNEGDLEGLKELFDPSPRIVNAANPPSEGPTAVANLLNDFFTRTSERRFELLDAAEGDGEVFAAWMGHLTMTAGLRINDIVLAEPLNITLRGIERFQLSPEGKIVQLDIVHETTSIYRSAVEAAKHEQE